ncbi:MAG: anthranilate synthase component I family protein [Thermoguttaceae bacterium]|nr:anthranilate synthase component I family protein [Thermoguttaceae bacterium]MDW8036880.1 anthranilate synthase component I family protein [Thermoguttaceae bacterium]
MWTEWPVVELLSPQWTPEKVFRRLVELPHCLFLDSAVQHSHLGRYSFVAADPFEYLEVEEGGRDGLAELAARLESFATPPAPDLPPFQGGAAGLFSYELVRQWERLPKAWWDEFKLPMLAVGFYDVVVAFDHWEGRAWIISQGFPERDPTQRLRRARQRLQECKTRLLDYEQTKVFVCTEQTTAFATEGALNRAIPSKTRSAGVEDFWQIKGAGGPLPEVATGAPPEGILLPEQLAPQYPLEGLPLIRSNFSPAKFQEAVGRVIEYICAGDVFQVNLAQRLLLPAQEPAWQLYLRLRRLHPAPFAGYFDLGRFQIVSGSPERFLCVRHRQVETRPIKGTRPRTGDPLQDQAAIRQLLTSEKDRAENVMIVDLLRNDLSRVCLPESIRVSQLCALETYARVFHLVSAVQGLLRPECSLVDLVRACFPGGSVTGAPKVRAMEIIAELEPTVRGAYCGSLGYIGFEGSMDLNLLIRTITVGRGWWQLHVGGGITVLSDPWQEYQETWHKAQGLLQAMMGRSLQENLTPF